MHAARDKYANRFMCYTFKCLERLWVRGDDDIKECYIEQYSSLFRVIAQNITRERARLRKV